MQRARIRIPVGILVSLFIVAGCATMTSSGGARRETGGGDGDDQLPTCNGLSNCASGSALPKAVCANDGQASEAFVGTTVVADLSDGVSSDGRGPYIHQGTDGTGTVSAVTGIAVLGIGKANDSIRNPRKLTVNLTHPVPGGGGVPLGIITDGNDNGIVVERQKVRDTLPRVSDIPVGQTVTAAQLNVAFHLNGRVYLLQMGPQPYGHCHSGPNLVNGTGTSPGTIYRASRAKWVFDLPAGSVGRLFDLSNTKAHAVDKGLYFVHLHFEIANAVAGVGGALRIAAETQGGAGVVARYRALKRDSAQAYLFDERELRSAGYWLLQNKKAHDAAVVFRLVVEEYPNSWASHDGLGESYLAAGDTSKAIASYRRSLELNPKNQDAADVLKRLGGKR